MWEDILGNNQHKKFLQHYLQSDARPHALLFVGAEGLGKRLLAMAFAKSLLCFNSVGNDNCQSCKQFAVGAHPDFVEVKLEDDKKTLTIDQVRDLIAGSAFAPTLGKNKVVLINDIDLMRTEAANAILKLLEEPPASWTIILTATKEERLLPTILSRVVTLRFKPLAAEDVKQVFSEQIDDKEHADIYARLSDGSIGMAISLFEHDALDLRKHALKLLSSLPTRFPLNLAVALEGELDEIKRLERADIILWLRLLQLLLRDILVLKTADYELYNEDVHFELQKIAANVTEDGLQKSLAEVERANADLLGNVGVKQVLENLILNINTELERR